MFGKTLEILMREVACQPQGVNSSSQNKNMQTRQKTSQFNSKQLPLNAIIMKAYANKNELAYFQ